MSIQTLSATSPYLSDRYIFRSQSNDKRLLTETRLDHTPPSPKKRYKFSVINPQQYPDIYKFPTDQYENRIDLSDTNRYYFSTGNLTSKQISPRSVTFIEESSSANTPYFFSKTPRSPETALTHQRQQPQKKLRIDIDPSVRSASVSPRYRQSRRMDTITSTNGSLSVIKRSSPREKSPTVRFEPSSLSTKTRKRDDRVSEPFDTSVDRLISSVKRKSHQQTQTISSTTTLSSSMDYISQYYAKADEQSIETSDENRKFSYKLNINNTHTQIMKSVNKSLIDRNYHVDKNRLKTFEDNVRRYLRLYENQSLQRELNYDLIRCFSSSYLHDLRQEDLRQNQIRSNIRSYTYEDIQDIYMPKNFDAYKLKLTTDKEKYQRLQLLFPNEQLSQGTSSEYSSLMIRSLNENIDTQSTRFDTDRKSLSTLSHISPNVDIFYEIMQENFRGVDASIAGHISKVSQISRDIDSDIDIKSGSSFWSDEDSYSQHKSQQRKQITPQPKLSRYLSTVNRSLLDHPSDLIADFYIAQLNRDMQDRVRHIERISHDKATKKHFYDYNRLNLYRSLSAEHLYEVRKEHIRYQQPYKRPTSFTTEDVADIYKKFVLENYKRKIAIELERRRRQRQGQSIQIRTSYQPPRTRNDFILVSPPVLVETREVVMARARRSIANDGSSDVVHHISTVSPPAIYSIDQRPSVNLTAINESYDNSYITTVHPPDFVDRHQRAESPTSLGRALPNIYTNIPQTISIPLCHAKRVDADTEDLSMVNIEPIITLNQHEVNDIIDETYIVQILKDIEQQSKQRLTSLIAPIEQHISTIHEEIPVFENMPRSSIIHRADQTSVDTGFSFTTPQIRQPLTIFNRPSEIINEPLPELRRTIIRNDIPYIDLSTEPVARALLLEDLTTAINKQRATQITDKDYYWKTCEKVQENTRVPIIVYDSEWKDEEVKIISDKHKTNIANAEYIYPENIEYQYVKTDCPEIRETYDIIIEYEEEVISLPADSYLIRHQQQSNIHRDQLPNLENPIRSRDILTLNYPYHHHSPNERQTSLSTNSQISSYNEMETFLNQFEESLEHEQHLPLINQISVSYASSPTNNHPQNQTKYRSIPTEWYIPTVHLHDEQLVEQYIVEKNLDTIQQEGTLHRQQVEFLYNNLCETIIHPISNDIFSTNQKFHEITSNNSTLREHHDGLSHCSPTSDYESDTVEKDNDTVTSTVIIPLTFLPSSSITNTTLLSQSSPSCLTSHTPSIAPIIYLLDVLAHEKKELNNSTKDFLLTIGFGQNPMNELTNTVSTFEQPLRPTWVNRSIDNLEIIPTTIHHEDETTVSSLAQQPLHFATENQLEDDNTALIIYPLYLQQGYHPIERAQAYLSTFLEPTNLHLHVPTINETHTYQADPHNQNPFLHPPNISPQRLTSKVHENELILPDKYQLDQPVILYHAQITHSPDHEEQTQPLTIKRDQPTYIEHYHIQPLFPFPKTCYAQIHQPEIITDTSIHTTPTPPTTTTNNNHDFLSNFILTKPNKFEDDNLLNRFIQDDKQNQAKYSDTDIFNTTSTFEVRPPASTKPSPVYEQVKMRKDVDVNMGTTGQYKQQANYTYGNERDLTRKSYSPERPRDTTESQIISTRYNQSDDIYVPEKIIEHISEDEKSTSSEEVVFEEWTEEFRCRLTKEFDGQTNQLLRQTIDETSDRVKSDVVKEEYKGKNTRIKGHKSYDVVKEVYRPASTKTYEEIPKPSLPPPPSSTSDRAWTSEEIYTTEIVQDPTVAKQIESSTNYERVHPGTYSPIPSTTQPTISTHKQKQDPEEEFFMEEYEVEVQTPIKRDETSTDDFPGRKSPTKYDSDWNTKYQQIYSLPSDDNQYKDSNRGSYIAQRVSVIPTNTQQQRFKEVQIKVPGHDRTSADQRRYFQSTSPSRHTVKEVVVCLPRGSSPEKSYRTSLFDEHEEQRRNRTFFDSETQRKTSSGDDDYSPQSKYNSSSSGFVIERRSPHESTDRPTYGRVGEIRNSFENGMTKGSVRETTTKHETPITSGLTEQRRRIFEEQEWARQSANDFSTNERRMSETHTGPSLVSDRISRIESSMTKTTPQTYRTRQVISSIDSDISGPTQPIYQSTPKSVKQKYSDDDAGHESEDELSDPKQHYDIRRRTSKTRSRDFSQSTSQSIDATNIVQRTIAKFNEKDMENVLSRVPTSKGKGILIELTPHSSQSPTKSNLLSDSGVFDYSTTSHQIGTSSPSWRQNVSTSVNDETGRSRDNNFYIDSTVTNSPYNQRDISDREQNMDDSLSRSTYVYNRDVLANQQQQQHQPSRTVRRQIRNYPSTNYENLSDYRSKIDPQGKVPITTQSRTVKPYAVDEVETVETETHVECQVQRTNESTESTRTERTSSPTTPTRRILTTTTTITPRSTDETTPSKRVLLNERPQYYESVRDETQIYSTERTHSHDDSPYSTPRRTYTTIPRTLEVTSLSPRNQVTFNKYSPNEIIAVVRVPELSNSPIRHGTSESNLYEKSNQEQKSPRLHYQRVHAASYRPPLMTDSYEQRQSRSRLSPSETTNDYSSPVNIPTRSASYHSILDEQNQQQQKQQGYYPQTRYHSGSLGNLEFEIEIEKRPPQHPEQPTRISLDQPSRAIVTTSKDGRVSIQNVAAYPGNTVVINSDYHSSGYFSSDEPRSQGHTTNYSSDEQSSARNQKTYAKRTYQIPTDYDFNQINDLVKNSSQSPRNFNETINRIDTVYTNIDNQTNDFAKLNRRKQLTQNPSEYSQRYTSTGFQHIPYEQQETSVTTDLVMSTPNRPIPSATSSGILADYGTPASPYGSIQNLVVQQNRSQTPQKNRTSVKQVKQRSAAKKRNGNTQGQFSDDDEDDDDDSPLSDNGRFQPSSRVYSFNNNHQ